MAEGSEKREFERSRVAVHAEVRADGDRVVSGRVRDVSINGVFVECKSPFEKGTLCRVHLLLGGGVSQIALDAVGKIVRSVKTGMAVEFSEIGPASLKHLKNLVLYNAEDPDKTSQQFKKK